MSEIDRTFATRHVVDSWERLEAEGDNEFVSVNYEVLDELAAQNPDLEVPDWRIPGLNPKNDWAFATQTLVSSVINYAYLDKNVPGGTWSMEDPETGKQIASSDALHIRTRQVFGEAEDITSDQIKTLIEPAEFEKYLPGIPMAESRRRLLGQFAAGLEWGHSGSIRNLINHSVDATGRLRAFNNGVGLVDNLTGPMFRDAYFDTSNLGSMSFPFNKRAQLAPLLIYGRALTSDVLPKLADIDKIGPVVDYQLPRALRWWDALDYAPQLAEYVDNWRPIQADSKMEIEVRGATAKAVDYVLKQLNIVRAELGEEPRNMAHADFWLWKKGRELKKLENPPLQHFTETTAY